MAPRVAPKKVAVMPVGPAGDERQRDATRVHQEAALAPIFSPDPWSLVPRTVGPEAACPSPHPRSANARQYPPFRRTRPGGLPYLLEKAFPLPARKWTCTALPNSLGSAF